MEIKTSIIKKEKHMHPYIKDKFDLSYYLGGASFKELFGVLRSKDECYRMIEVKKKNGKKRRVYDIKYPLKAYQYYINTNILKEYDISKYATAYYKGASIKKNAEKHCGKRYLLKMDLADFFAHITEDMVRANVFNKKHFSPFICYALTKLCTYEGHIVQGAITSPTISNIVMKHFDDVMGMWCKKNDISFSRYSDDITFSSNKPLYPAYCKAKSLLTKMGFELNENKTKFITNANRQMVNGVVVNEVPRVTREYRRNLRQEVYYVLRYNLYANDTKYTEQLMGKVSWILQINPEDKYFKDAKYQLHNQCCSYDNLS